MGYDIFYNRQFIKLTETEIVPFVEVGSSNCYEPTSSGKMRRERTWYNLRIGNKFYGTLAEMISNTETILQELIERYEDEADKVVSNFGYYYCVSLDGTRGCKGSFGKYQSLFKNGVKNALTIEELLAENIHIRVYSSSYGTGKLSEANLEAIDVYPKTSKELKEILDSENFKLVSSLIGCYITSNSSEYAFKRIRSYRKPIPKDKTKVSVTKQYVLESELGYLVTYSNRRKSYISTYIENANKYNTKGQAERKAKSHNARYLAKVKVVEITLSEPKEVVKNW